mgnify:CR=1 FL=1
MRGIYNEDWIWMRPCSNWLKEWTYWIYDRKGLRMCWLWHRLWWKRRNDDPIYANTAIRLAPSVAAGECDRGILICGTGIGISVAANKVPGVIAAVCSEPYSAKLTKQHNNANVIAFGARVVGVELAKMILDEFFGAEFEGGRHQARVDMIHGIEADYSK